jgi:plasmid stabilization system protein ParE
VSLPVRVTPEAETQIREIDSWWRENRLAVPDLFLSELTESFHLIAGAPQIGRLYRKSPVRNARRLLLKRTRYHVY